MPLTRPTTAGPALHARRVSVRAPGRLHLGFLDPAATLGRRFGSIGLVVDGFQTVVEVAAACDGEAAGNDRISFGDRAGADANADADADADANPDAHAHADERFRVREHLRALREHTGLGQPLHLRIAERLPAHAGFGSGTQLALAVGRAFVQWHGLSVATPTLAAWLGRGLRSGVGIAGFDQGGLLVDGGPSADGTPAPLLARFAFPAAWRVVVVLDRQRRGLSGPAEKRAMATLAPLSRDHSADICHQLVMRVLPGAASTDFPAFAAGLTAIQQRLGQHFAPAQGGSAFTSMAVAAWLEHAVARFDGLATIGQSSWGPTGFAIVESQSQAEALVAAASVDRAAGASALECRIVGGRNHGAELLDAGLDPGVDRHADPHADPREFAAEALHDGVRGAPRGSFPST